MNRHVRQFPELTNTTTSLLSPIPPLPPYHPTPPPTIHLEEMSSLPPPSYDVVVSTNAKTVPVPSAPPATLTPTPYSAPPFRPAASTPLTSPVSGRYSSAYQPSTPTYPSTPSYASDPDPPPIARASSRRVPNANGLELCPCFLFLGALFRGTCPDKCLPHDPPLTGWMNGSFHTSLRMCGWPLCGCGSSPRACIAIGAFPTGFLFALGWVTLSWGIGIGQATFGLLCAVGQVALAPMGFSIGQLALGVVAGLGQVATGVFVGGLVKLGKYDLLKLFKDGEIQDAKIVG